MNRKDKLIARFLSMLFDKGSARLMKNLEYKGYTGSIEYNKEDDLLYEKVLGIRGLISYEGETL